MLDCNATQTPMEENLKLSSWMSPGTPEGQAVMKAYPYRELIGKLLYLAIAMHPDITYAMGILCHFVDNPSLKHWYAAKRVLQYLKGTTNMKLIYSCWMTEDLFTTYSDT